MQKLKLSLNRNSYNDLKLTYLFINICPITSLTVTSSEYGYHISLVIKQGFFPPKTIQKI